MTEHINPNRAAKLELNARAYQPDPQLDRALELFNSDRAAFDRLPQQLRSQVGIYIDFKQNYEDAVTAGVIQADRGPVQ